MLYRMSLVPAVALLMAAQLPAQKGKPSNLDGTWAVVSFEMDGKKLPDKTVKNIKMVFEGSRLTIRQGGKTLGAGTFKINQGRKPFAIDYREAPDIVSPYDAGILQIDGDMMRFCTSADPGKRPTAFDSKLGWLFVLKREAGPKTTTSTVAISYARQVRPFLAKYCIECHNAKTLEAGLDLETYQSLRKGSDNGQVMLPGNPDGSPLVMLAEGKKKPQMPPKKAKRHPAATEVAVLRAWVAAGATDDSAGLRVAIPNIKPRGPAKGAIAALAYRADSQLLAAGQYQTIILIDPTTNAVLKPLTGLPGPVTALAFNPLGTRLVIASGEPGMSGVLFFFSVPPAGQNWETPRPIPAHKDLILDIAFSPDGKTLATASYDTTVKLWDAVIGKELHTLREHSDSVYGVSFSPNGKLLATGAADRAVKVWDAATGALLYTFGAPTDWTYAVAWSPDGRHLAAGGVDKSIRVWETGPEKGRIVKSVFAHEGPVIRLVYAADGKTLYSLGEDRTVKAWDAAQMVERKVYPRQAEATLALALRPDGKQLALGRYDGVVVLVDEATGRTGFQVGQKTVKPAPIAKVAKAKPPLPQPKKVMPGTGQRGRPLALTFTGMNLDQVDSLTVNQPGVTARIVPKGRAAGVLHAELLFPPTTPAGVYQLTLHNAGGKSAPLSFTVDLFPLINEMEGNDSPGRGQRIDLPASVAGVIGKAGDVDFFTFTAKKGQQVGAQVLTATVGSKLDPYLEVTDMSGRVLAQSTGLIGYTFSQAGTYALGVRDRDFRGNSTMHYRLHIGAIPIVTTVFPLGLQRGTEVNLQIEGVNLGGSGVKFQVKAPADAAIGSRLPISFSTPLGTPLGAKNAVVGEFPETAALSQPAGAILGPLPIPGTANGILRAAGQTDTWRFAARKGHRLILEVNARRLGTPLDSFIQIVDSKNQLVARATLRSLAKTFVVFRDHDSAGAGIRIDAWDELAVNDFILLGSELLRILNLPPNPDADCEFFSERGKRKGFLDTTPTHHAMGTAMYKVEIHPPGTVFPPNGFPVTTLYYRNDDGGSGFGRDSRLVFDPPADAEYRVRIGDSRGQGGRDYAYRLTVRPPRPSFNVSFSPTAPMVAKGNAAAISVTAERIDGYDGDIDLRLENLPAGFQAPATSIPAGANSTVFALYAGADANTAAMTKPFGLSARARIEGREVIKEVAGGMPKLVAPGDLVTTTRKAEVSVKPGGKVTLTVDIVRRNGFKGRVPLEVRGLPHGVRVLDIGLNGILINENETRRTIVIQADAWVQPLTHPFVVLSRREGKNSEHAARSVLLRVVR